MYQNPFSAGVNVAHPDRGLLFTLHPPAKEVPVRNPADLINEYTLRYDPLVVIENRGYARSHR